MNTFNYDIALEDEYLHIISDLFSKNEIFKICDIYTDASKELDYLPRVHCKLSEIMMNINENEKAYFAAQNAIIDNEVILEHNKNNATIYYLGYSHFNAIFAIDDSNNYLETLKYKYIKSSLWYLNNALENNDNSSIYSDYFIYKNVLFFPYFNLSQLLLLDSFEIFTKYSDNTFNRYYIAYFFLNSCKYFINRTQNYYSENEQIINYGINDLQNSVDNLVNNINREAEKIKRDIDRMITFIVSSLIEIDENIMHSEYSKYSAIIENLNNEYK